MPVNPEELFLIRFGLIAIIMTAASVWDIRKRIVPNFLPVALSLTALFPVPDIHPGGIIVAVLLLLLGIFVGGIGGGDIKMIAAYGIVAGALQTVLAVTVSMMLLLMFHGIRNLIRKGMAKEKAAYPLMPFLTMGALAAWLICL